MPSANVKIVKKVAPDNGLTVNTPATPLRQAITVIEHKIRNLEKRKLKLETYRDLQKSGKELNQDQKIAVAKFDEVVQTLEFARDICKQFLGIALISEKDDKKRIRKEAMQRSQQELTKVREVLLVQDVLTNLGQEAIRDDFLNGRNGAAQLTEADIKLLDDLYSGVTPKHEPGNPTAFTTQVQAAAEHLAAVVDGKSKVVFDGTYSKIKDVIGKVHESGYLDQAAYTEETPAVPVEDIEHGQIVMNSVEPIPVQALESMTLEGRPPVIAPIVEQPPTQQQAIDAPIAMQQPVPEQIYYQQQQQAPPPQRPITEVLGTGSFFFLQDSELDTPPEQIPSQTFTNQTYVAAPPPPIPMPPHFQQFPNNPQAQSMQPVVPQQVQQPPQHQQQPSQQAKQVTSHSNNGIGDHLPEAHEDLSRHRGGMGNAAAAGGGGGGGGNRHHQQRSNNTSHHQPYFSNNNGYNNNNRPNRNRNNGPRSNTRHNQ